MSGQSRGALFDSDDIVPVLIEGVLRLVWWLVRTVISLVLFAVRVPSSPSRPPSWSRSVSPTGGPSPSGRPWP